MRKRGSKTSDTSNSGIFKECTGKILYEQPVNFCTGNKNVNDHLPNC